MSLNPENEICPKCKSPNAVKYDPNDWTYVCVDCSIRFFQADIRKDWDKSTPQWVE